MSSQAPSKTPNPAKKKRQRKKKSKRAQGKQPQNSVNSSQKFEDAIVKIETAASMNTPIGQAAMPSNLNKAQKYALSLIDPFNFGSRIPDSDGADSAFFLSVQNFYPGVNTGTGLANPGAFSMAFQPKFGSPANPLSFKNAICDPVALSQAPDATDWSSAGAYVSSLGGINPRMVNEIDVLAFNDTGFASFSSGTVVSNSLPFGNGTTPIVSNAGNGFTPVDYQSNTGDFILVPGQYLIAMSATGTVLTDIITSGSTATVQNWVPVNVNSAGTLVTEAWLVTASTDAARFRPTIAGASTTAAIITIAPIAKTDSTQSLNNGMVEKLRPTCMSVLVSYVGTTLKDGGTIASAFVSGDALSSRFFAQSASDNVGSFRTVESVANVPLAYNGPLKKGTYTFWKPLSEADRLYYNVSESNNYMYPSIVITGQYNPDDIATTGIQRPIRVTVVTGYEYQTTSQLPEKARYRGSEAMVDAALNMVDSEGIMQCMANAEHTGFIDKFKGWVRDAANYLGKGLSWGKSAINQVEKLAPAARSFIETIEPMLALA